MACGRYRRQHHISLFYFHHKETILWQNNLLNLFISLYLLWYQPPLLLSRLSLTNGLTMGKPILPNPSPQSSCIPERAAKTFNLTLTAWSSTGGSKMFFRSFPHRAGRSRAGHDTQLLEEGRRRRRSHQVQGSAWLRAVPTLKLALQHLHQGGWKPSSPLLPAAVPCGPRSTHRTMATLWTGLFIDTHGHLAPPKNNCAAELYLLLSCYLVYPQSCWSAVHHHTPNN